MLYEKMTIGNRVIKIYEIDKGKYRKWEVWESINRRGTRLFGPSSRVKCYEYIRELECKEATKRVYEEGV